MILAALSFDLGVSVFFGLAQLGVGIALVRRLAQGWRWTNRPIVIGALAGLWLLISGAGECLVAALALAGSRHIAQARGIVDSVLLGATVALIITLIGYLVILRTYTSRAVR
jgi:hypothetical protein